MDEKKKKKGTFTIDVLMTGPAGELVFKPIDVDPDNIDELLKATKDPIIRFNIKKELARRKKHDNEE